MHKPESVLENKIQKILWNFEIQIRSPNTDQEVRSSVNWQEEVNMSSSWLCHSKGWQSENLRKQKDRQILGFCQRAEKSCGTWRWW